MQVTAQFWPTFQAIIRHKGCQKNVENYIKVLWVHEDVFTVGLGSHTQLTGTLKFDLYFKSHLRFLASQP